MSSELPTAGETGVGGQRGGGKASFAAGLTKNMRRRLQYRQRRETALFLVAATGGKDVPVCFMQDKYCEGSLELDHLVYETDSVKASHGNLRVVEALEHPERFRLLCKNHHLREHVIRLKEKGLPIGSPPIGKDHQANEAILSRVESQKQRGPRIVQVTTGKAIGGQTAFEKSLRLPYHLRPSPRPWELSEWEARQVDGEENEWD